jgi:hypothetical protein
MQDQGNAIPTIRKQTPWNKDKLTGAKPPLRPKHVWSGCDVVAIKVDDVATGGYTADRAAVRQKKTGRPWRAVTTNVDTFERA